VAFFPQASASSRLAATQLRSGEHAMTNPSVTLVNPNKIHPPITPYALDILTTGLERAGFDVSVLDLTNNGAEVMARGGRTALPRP